MRRERYFQENSKKKEKKKKEISLCSPFLNVYFENQSQEGNVFDETLAPFSEFFCFLRNRQIKKFSKPFKLEIYRSVSSKFNFPVRLE